MATTKTEQPAKQWQIHFSMPTRKDIRYVFKPPPEEKHRRWRLFKSYIVDWIIVVIVNAGGGAFGALGPRHREFSLHDRSIRYSHHYSYVPDFVPPLVGYASPVLSAILFLIIRRRNWHDFHCAVLGIFLAMGLNNIATNVLKNACGRPRPDFIARCNPSVDKDPPLKLVDYTVCQQTDLSYLHEGMRSFPSGHASLSFCGLTFTALYLASHFRYNDQRGHAYKSLVFYVPLFCATLIAVSRTADYHHHWSDVLAGSVMGCYIGWFGYRTYFPPVFDPMVLSDRPYPRRIPKPANLAHIGYSNGHLLPVDEDPYQVGSSGHSSSLQLTRPHASNTQMAATEQPAVIQIDPEIQPPTSLTMPADSLHVNMVRASRQVAHEEPAPKQPAAGASE
ncbi:PAP2-domain-containing protein [Linderina pennispora]|uniref:PAP2-domain-containing protein n=1 Tax=Linderina pennispora TaxID=61395 RepID=A0A1Y1W7X3_9FUNG|nr:PAP2-domain-containing protein [Linderina pennispora]ORX69633.1 PAP2-domain-containing protein [Linderina pennispora]